MRDARTSDVSTLVELMAEFGAEADYTINRTRARVAFEGLLADPSLGRVWLIESGSTVVGYAVATFIFAMEYGGMVAFLDDFFVRPEFRDRGLGTSALAGIRDAVSSLGGRAMFVEVAGDNDRAISVYGRTGFEMTDRRLMALPLKLPTHDIPG
jgi:ribosomal protein S18 acetylase RimI-like enzyme